MGRELSFFKVLYRPKASSGSQGCSSGKLARLFPHPSSFHGNKASPVQLREPPRHCISARLCFNARSEPRRQHQTR